MKLLFLSLALALLMPGVFTNHPQDAVAANHLALGTNSFHRGPDFHGDLLEQFALETVRVTAGKARLLLFRCKDLQANPCRAFQG
jgi:hypothetical protein